MQQVRGGQEKRRGWYKAARFAAKPNTFHDAIAVAECLIELHITAAGKIVVHSSSTGGLLVGAVLNMRPALLGGAIADGPFVDGLTTILDVTLPLTPAEWTQRAKTLLSASAFRDILLYSPVDNVSPRGYPPKRVTAGVSDLRVTYWEAAKRVAKLREYKTDNNLNYPQNEQAVGTHWSNGPHCSAGQPGSCLYICDHGELLSNGRQNNQAR